MKHFSLLMACLCHMLTYAQNETSVNAPCTNEGFESMTLGTVTAVPGWTIGRGNYAGTGGLCTSYPATMATQAVIMSVPLTNPLLTPTAVPASPFTGTNVLFFSTTNMGAMFKRIEQTFSVTSTNAFFQCSFFGSVPSNPHSTCCDNSYFKIQLFDCNNVAIPMASLQAIPFGGTGGCINTGTVGMVIHPSNAYAYTPNWLIKNANLAPYIGSCVRFVAEVGMCTPMAHHQSIFLDFQCTAAPYTVNGVNTGTTTNYVICDATTATLTSAVANSYTWTGPSSITSNAQTLITSTPGIYLLSTDNLADPALTQTINVAFDITPTISAIASSTVICQSPPTSVSLTAPGTGASTYNWSLGANTASLMVITPAATAVYTVIANKATCPASATVAVKVVNCAQLGEATFSEPLQIYPNPSQDAFTIRSANEQTLVLRDISGRTLETLVFTKAGNYTVTVSDLPEGVYFVSDKTRTYKIVVLR